MGIFSNTPGLFDAEVDKVTPEEDKGTEDWGSILDICDKVGTSSANAKDCLKSITRRLNHPSPHVVLKAISLLDSCVKNCPKTFHLEIASRDFEADYRKLLKKYQSSQPRLADSLKSLLRKWAENDFKSDADLSLIPALYNKLKSEGVDFSPSMDSAPKRNTALPKDPDTVTSQQEVDDIAKAIELSLKDTSSASGPSSLYPSTNSVNASTPNKSHNPSSQSSKPTVSKPKVIVKALYDFLDVEDNELVFYAGELIEVLDDSDKNWWKGATRRGEGLFPANFVTFNLSSDEPRVPESENPSKSSVRFNDNVAVHHTINVKHEDIIINEQKIDRLLHLLHEANPTDESADTEEMINLEEEVNAMGPLIDAELEKVDRKHAQLTQLSSNLVDALNLYHSLMREQPYPGHPMADPTYGSMSIPVHTLPHPHAMMFNSGLNGPYPMPPAGMMSDQYASNSLPGPMPQTGNVHDMSQPPSHHFVPISAVSMQAESFHPPPVMTNSPATQQSYNLRLDPNMGPVQFNMPPNPLISPQQMPQNLYQPVQRQMPLQEVSSPGSSLPNNNM